MTTKNEHNIGKILTVSYIVLSAIFIIAAIFVYFRMGVYNAGLNSGYNAGYNAGESNTINAIMEQAAKEKCKALELSLGENKLELIDMSCLQPAPTEGEGVAQ